MFRSPHQAVVFAIGVGFIFWVTTFGWPAPQCPDMAAPADFGAQVEEGYSTVPSEVALPSGLRLQ